LHDVVFQGLGDTGHGWSPVADMFCKDSELAHIKWVLPHSYVTTSIIDQHLQLTETMTSHCLHELIPEFIGFFYL